MADEPLFDDAVASNIAAARARRRGLTQKSLATRMQALGFGWRQQTAASVERGERRVTVAEIFGLALALESSVAKLLSPDNGAVVLPSGDVLPADFAAAVITGIMEGNVVSWQDDRPVFRSPDFSQSAFARLLAQLAIHPESDYKIQRRADGATVLTIGQDLGADYPELPQQPVVAAIVTSAKGVLIGRRNDRTPPWTFVAGEQEPGEQPEDTIIREVKEETGLDIRAGQVIGERHHPATGRHMIYMSARPVAGTRVFVGDEAELAEVRWVGLAEADDLLPDMFPPVRDYLERTIEG